MTSVTVICDSISAEKIRLVTAKLVIEPEHSHYLQAQHNFPRTQRRTSVLVTATGHRWQRFLTRPQHAEMRGLMRQIELALVHSKPRLRELGDWHLPYIDGCAIEDIVAHVLDDGPQCGLDFEDVAACVEMLACKLSAARCARISGRPVGITQEIKNFDELLHSGRRDYLEHQATPDALVRGVWKKPQFHGNFHGWQQYRKGFVEENNFYLLAA